MKKLKSAVAKGRQAVNNGIDASKDAYHSAAVTTQKAVQTVTSIAKTAKEVVHVSAVATTTVMEKVTLPLLKFTANATASKPEAPSDATPIVATPSTVKPSA